VNRRREHHSEYPANAFFRPEWTGPGGGIMVAYPGKMTMSNSQVLGNNATAKGPGRGQVEEFTPSAAAVQSRRSQRNFTHRPRATGRGLDTGGRRSIKVRSSQGNTSGGSGGGIWFNGGPGNPRASAK
jgi:hypothetical protein